MTKYTAADLNWAANQTILAMDGKLARADALAIARQVLEGFGVERDAASFQQQKADIGKRVRDRERWAI